MKTNYPKDETPEITEPEEIAVAFLALSVSKTLNKVTQTGRPVKVTKRGVPTHLIVPITKRRGQELSWLDQFELLRKPA